MKELRTSHVVAMMDGWPCVASVFCLSKCLGPKVLPRIFQKMLGKELEGPGDCGGSATTHPEVGSQQPQNTQKPDGASLDQPSICRQIDELTHTAEG